MQKPCRRAIVEQAATEPLVGRRQEDECIIAVVRQDVLLLRLPVDVELQGAVLLEYLEIQRSSFVPILASESLVYGLWRVRPAASFESVHDSLVNSSRFGRGSLGEWLQVERVLLIQDDHHAQIQTKFTPVWAHDKDKIPFNPHQNIEGQITESVRQSLQHLQVDYLDSLLLHVPFEQNGDNLIAWKVLETFVPHTIRSLGVSNFKLPQLEEVYASATIKPVIVQNRFYKETGFDFAVREFCAERGITYQAYWMLRHNPEILASDILQSVAVKLNVEEELAFYVLVLGLGGTQVLNGTTNPERMVQDLKIVGEVFGDEARLRELQPDIDEFRGLLLRLSARAE